MSEERKRVIIDEIHYWRANKLLPEHYCNFLLMLYTQGEVRANNRIPLFYTAVLLFVFIGMALVFFLHYATDTSIGIKAGASGMLTIAVFLLALWLRNRERMAFHIFIAAAALLLFVTTTNVAFFTENSGVLITTIFINLSAWMAAGLYWKLAYLQWSGAGGVLLAGVYIITSL
ncbi:hypothetical protein SAMN05192534_10662 [Alteribacillus persepolensis]|uniref:Uncharacterized protein n=1 Tax=Alteribacillus persepolensis TaxID=568899 RepID=A0A1G8CS18_9BACI|nr:hypothetical protein [Alteribacillus persepolensis]SDH48337.1 hypothetical protein SAMN05192534_10662 [Alteribacillus persepolensis]